MRPPSGRAQTGSSAPANGALTASGAERARGATTSRAGVQDPRVRSRSADDERRHLARRPEAAGSPRAAPAPRGHGRSRPTASSSSSGASSRRKPRRPRSRTSSRNSGRLLGAKDVLVTKAPGYLLRVAPGQLDLHRFERLVTEARGLAAQRSGRSYCGRRWPCGAARRSPTSRSRASSRPRSAGSRSCGCRRSRSGSTPISS